MISLDVELIESLNKTNASKLINSMLTDYFFGGGDLKKEEIKLEIKKLQEEIKRNTEKILLLKKKLETIEIKKEEVKKKFVKIPNNIIEDFRDFPLMSEEALRTRFNMGYKGQVEWEELLAAYREYFKK